MTARQGETPFALSAATRSLSPSRMDSASIFPSMTVADMSETSPFAKLLETLAPSAAEHDLVAALASREYSVGAGPEGIAEFPRALPVVDLVDALLFYV